MLGPVMLDILETVRIASFDMLYRLNRRTKC